MKKVCIVTGNSGKVESLKRKLNKYNIEVEQKELELFEIQADEIEEVSINKAKQAYEILKEPLIVDDSGLFIEELNGFPGVYTKYVLSSIGVNGIMDMMKGKKNRKCGFESVATFVDSNGRVRVFKGDFEEGQIANEIDNIERKEAWSGLWKIFIPFGYDKTLSQFSPKERSERKYKIKGETAFTKFTKWLTENSEERL